MTAGLWYFGLVVVLRSLRCDDTLFRMVWSGVNEEEACMVLETNTRRQRLKRKRKWPLWVRSVSLLKWALRIGPVLYRLWRFWNWLNGEPED